MLGGKGYFRASTVLLSGTAGTGKTTLAAQFLEAACARGEKCMYFLFEESPSQLIRNMRSAGIDLQKWVDKGLLKFHADRPNRHGLETHLLEMHHAVEVFDPDVVVLDPITNLMAVGTQSDVRAMLTRVIDYFKTRGVTAVFTSLTSSTQSLEATESMISSLMDTWILVAVAEEDRKRNRWIYVLKSRGMPHSNDVRAFEITDHGVVITPLDKGSRRGTRCRPRPGHAACPRLPRGNANERKLRAEIVCRRPDAEGRARVLQSSQDLRGTSCRGDTASKSSISSRTRRWAVAIRSWRCRRSCAGCQRLSRRSSAICPTPSVYSSGSICDHAGPARE